jgi:hypothetical protein
MKSIDFIKVKNSLNWNTPSYSNILIPLNQLINWQWNYKSVNDLIKLAKAFQNHKLSVNIQNLAILSYRYNVCLSPTKDNPDSDTFWYHSDNASLDDLYTQLD